TYPTISTPSSNDMAVARLNSDGSLDHGFGQVGRQTIDFGGYEFTSGVALQPDEKIVVAGFSQRPGTSYDFAVARLFGDPDTSPPTAVSDSVTTDEDTAISGNVLTNDSDVDAGD